jgi:hypothetical protein
MAPLTPDREKLQPVLREKSQPVMVPETLVTGYNAALSSDQQTQTDVIGQVYRGTAPIVRLAPLPASGSATGNAAANSSAQVISQGSVASGIAINLSMPGEFTVGGTPAGATGTFKVAWAPEDALEVFCAPSTAYPFQAATSLSGDSGTASTANIVPGTVPMLAIQAVSTSGATVSPGPGWSAWPSTAPNIPNVPLFAQVTPSTFPIAGNAPFTPAGFWSAGVLLLAFNKTLLTAPVQSTNSSGGWTGNEGPYSLSGTTAGNTILVVINFTLTAGVGGISVSVSDGVNAYSHPVSTSSPNPSANTGTQVDMFVAQGIAGGSISLAVHGSPGTGNASSYEIYILEISGCPSGPGVPSFKLLTGAYIPPINLATGGNGGVTGDLPFAQVSGVPAFPVTKTAVTSEWLNSYDSTTGAFTQTQPSFTDISGVAAAAQLPSATGSAKGGIELNTDLGGTAAAPNVVATHLSSPLPIAQGGTGTASPALIPGTNITISGSWPNQTINSSGGSGLGGVSVKSAGYNIASGDNGTLVALSTGSFTFTLPTTPPSSTWTVFVENYGTGTLTLAPGGSADIDGSASSLSLTQNQGVVVFTDGTNYFTERGLGSGGGGGGVTSLNTLTGALTIAAGTNITVTPSGGNTLTIAASGGGGGGAAQSIWTYPKITGAPVTLNPINSGNMAFSANKVVFMYIHIDVPLSVGNFTFNPNTGDATHHYDWGMYDLTGTLIWNLGATIFGSTGQITTALAQGTVSIAAGNYWLAFTGNGTGMTMNGASPSSLAEYFYYANSASGTPVWWTSATSSSGGTLTGLSPAVPSAPTASNLSSNIIAGTSASCFPLIALST